MKSKLPFCILQILALVAFCSLGMQCGLAQSSAEKDIPVSLEELQASIQTIIDESSTAAAGIALVRGDSVIWTGSIGVSDKEKKTKADENTMYRIGSTSKMYASLSILKLVEDGKVNLDDKVRDLIPEIEFTNQWEDTHPVLVAHLLEHTTGWDDIHLPEYAHNDPTPVSLKGGLDFHPHSRISRWMPGTRMSYCNSGPPVAAYIVQKIRGIDFEEYVQQTFFDPMGMEHMTYRKSEVYNRTGAKLYEGDEEQPYWHILDRPSGSINASPVDMAKMIRFYLNRGHVDSLQIVSHASLRRMEQSKTTLGAKLGAEVGYGLSNYTTPYGGYMFHGHNGGVNGGLNDFAYAPELALGYNVSINSSDGKILEEVVDLIRDYLLGANKKEVEITPTFSSDGSIDGYYRPVNPRNQLIHFLENILNVDKISTVGDTTIRKIIWGGEPAKYYAINEDQFRSAETGLISLLKVNDPLTGQGIQANWNSYQKISAFRAWFPIVIAGLWLLFIIFGLLFGIVWLMMVFMGKIKGKSNSWGRFLPIISSISVLIGMIALAYGSMDPFAVLSAPTFVSVMVMLSTIAFALLAIYSLYYLIRHRKNGIHGFAYWFSFITCVLHVITMVYFLSHGVIGLQTWA